MDEILDIYDINKNKTNRKYVRGSNKLVEGEYVLVVEIAIINSKKQLLLSQRSEFKNNNPLKWETTQGSVKSGENSIEAAIRELNEELGLNMPKEVFKYVETIRDDKEHIFKDIFIINKDINISEVSFLDGEVIKVKWVNTDEFNEMKQCNSLAKNMNFKF